MVCLADVMSGLGVETTPVQSCSLIWYSASIQRPVPRYHIKLVGAGMGDGFPVDVLKVCKDPRVEFVLRCFDATRIWRCMARAIIVKKYAAN